MASVSVVVTTYNRSVYLRECIGSIRAQRIRDVEIIVVDDASAEAAPGPFDGDPVFADVVRLRHPENRGPGEGRNTGIRAARGRYIAFVDDDDLLEPCFLETALTVVDRDPSIGLFCCDAVLVDESGGVLYGGRTFNQINAAIKGYPLGSGRRSLEDVFMFSTIGIGFLAPRWVFDRVSYPVARKMEDYEFQLRVAGNGLGVYYLHEPLARYRMHAGNASGAGWMVEICERKVACLEEAFVTYPGLQRLRRRARARIADAQMELGLAYLRQGDYARAIATVGRSLAGDPRQLAEVARLAWRRAPRALRGSGRCAGAESAGGRM